ncbi:MAG: hypothetical protein JSS83_00900 [Cyanobacteria bacterium SZAS LIN-3]|nr:hypothetical protein [Cyanobacteria bacterium SZAS LIN-3]
MGLLVIVMFFAVLALGAVFFFLTVWGLWLIYRAIQKRRQEHAHRLASYLRRLRPVVGQLLHQANELDQASKYSGLDRDAKWSRKYQDALNKLLEANTKLEETNVALVEQDVSSAQDCLLYVIRTIHVVSYRLKEMEPVEELIEIKAEFKMEQARAANASEGQTSRGSTSSANVDGSHVIRTDSERKADEHSVLKTPEKRKEI